MIAIRLLSAEQFSKRLAPYGCRKIADLAPGLELWETGWKEPFTLTPEVRSFHGVKEYWYDEWQFKSAFAVVGDTMPPDWNNGGS
jgi:hypothetical protein